MKMQVYDPRLDTEPGAHPNDIKYWIWTDNPALIAAHFGNLPDGETVPPAAWPEIVNAANFCEEKIAKPMTETRARTILGGMLNGDRLSEWYDFEYVAGRSTGPQIPLDGYYTADELEAIAWWMRNKGVEK